MPRLSKIGAACLAAFGYTQGTSTVTANYLTVAGGGGGGAGLGGGGGAGGLLIGITNLNFTQSYVVTVGAGGASIASGFGNNGSNSIFSTFATATGGGGGGGTIVSGGTTGQGQNGGSGGGGSGGIGSTTGGTGTVGQGNNGGTGSGTTGTGNGAGAGGGGASAVGGTATSTNGGAGGAGTASSITGTSVTYAGGGGGASRAGTVGAGGAGGGGAGGINANGTAGTANTGGGGGGGGLSQAGATGGSGVVIISYTSPTQLFGGGIVTFVGGNWIHTFTTSGTLVPATTFTANFLVVAGGGGGANPFITVNSAGGGGGGGGYRTSAGTSGGGSSAETALTLDVNSNYIVTVGSGGAGNTGVDQGGNGGNSSFLTVTSIGGGGGGRQSRGGAIGGSGGGDCGTGNVANGTANQGYAGGIGVNGLVQGAAGGGGAGAVGGNTAGTGAGGVGGAGVASTITGTSVTRAGGGGGGGSGAGGTGGAGGGGNGGSGGAGIAGTANTGGGAGGSYGNITGQNGGSGIVIISYAGAQRMAGGNVTFVGGNTIHTFTSSGYLSALKLVNNSLRFKASTSSYLNRTFGTPTTQAKWTWSGWVKRGTLGSLVRLMSSGTTASDTTTTTVYFSASDTLAFSGGTTNFRVSNQVFRDPAAWYHIVIAVDTTQAVEANKILIYVNGVQITFATTNAITTCAFNSAQTAYIGQFMSSNYFDGYMTEINFVDGQALTPSSFGGYNSFGVWQPTQYLGSYGTNGFYLPFTNNTSATTIGYDFSPNQNNWTANGFTLTPTSSSAYDSMTDVPTLTSATASNYAVMNPLFGTVGTLSNANLSITSLSAGNTQRLSTMAVSSGKWYYEVTFSSLPTNTDPLAGFTEINNTSAVTQYPGQAANSYSIYTFTGNTFIQKVNNSTFTNTNTTIVAQGNIIGVALDLDNNKIWFAKNNVWVDSGDPVAGTNSQFTVSAGTYAPSIRSSGSGGTATLDANFGQRPFSYTPPTGFVALNTFNM
jgi:hypothetical protein